MESKNREHGLGGEIRANFDLDQKRVILIQQFERSSSVSVHARIALPPNIGDSSLVPFWVYMLECADGSYYVGHTDDIDKRMSEHWGGEVGGYTSTRRPVEVVFAEQFSSREEALAVELQIKRWSRKKKEALIRADWNEISSLARRRTPFRRS